MKSNRHVPFRYLVSASFLLLAGLCGCGLSGPEIVAPAKPSGKPPLPILTAEVVTVAPAAWPATVRAQGSLIADEVTVVGVKIAGRVDEVHFDLGDPVPADAPLVTLEQTEFQLRVAQAEALLSQARAAIGLTPQDDKDVRAPEQSPAVLEAKAVWDEVQIRRQRWRRLREQNAISLEEYEQTVAAEKVAESRYASALNGANEKLAQIRVRAADLALARQQLDDSETRSPFAATVLQRHVAPGAFVQVGQALLTLVRTGTLRFRGSIPERHAHKVLVGQHVTLTVESIADPLQLTISRISPSIDERSRALTFEADVDNRDGRLRSGMFAEGDVVVDPNARSLVVRGSAIVEFAGLEKVWKLVDGVAQEQVVQTGRRRTDGVEVVDGLAAGDIILADAHAGRAARIEPLAANDASSAPVSVSTVSTGSAGRLEGS